MYVFVSWKPFTTHGTFVLAIIFYQNVRIEKRTNIFQKEVNFIFKNFQNIFKNKIHKKFIKNS